MFRGGVGFTFSFYEPTGVSGQNASEVNHYSKASKSFQQGSSGTQRDRVLSKLITIEGGGSAVSIDLNSWTDSDGTSQAFKYVDEICLENLSDDSDAIMTVGPGASNGFSDPFDAADNKLRVKKGAKWLGMANGYTVDGTHKTLEVGNTSSAKTLTCRVRIAGRSE